MVNPFALPVWLGGLAWLFFGREGRRYRVLGWAYVVEVAVWMALHGKDYYAAPAYPMLFAAGGVAAEQWIERRGRAWLKPAFVVLFLALSLPFLPIIAPVLPRGSICPLSAGNPLLAAGQRARACRVAAAAVLLRRAGMGAAGRRDRPRLSQPASRCAGENRHQVDNFGEAGAVDLFGPKYGLPPAISGHQNYWLWGPRDYTGESMILIGEGRPEHLPHTSPTSKRWDTSNIPLALERDRHLLGPRLAVEPAGHLGRRETLAVRKGRG